MRTFTFLFLFLIGSIGLSAQEIVVTSSGGENSYGYSLADFGPSLLDSIYCGELSLVEPANGCDPISTDLTDKIAVIDRGECNFSLKCVNAQDQGAIAVIIVNNINTETFLMGGGTFGNDVDIPSMFVTLEVGDIIKGQMANETVTACMGNIIIENNLSGALDDVTGPLTVTVPTWNIEDDGSASFTPISRIRNAGTNDLTNVSSTVSIDFGQFGSSTTEVYSASTTPIELVAPGDSAFLESMAYDYSGSGVGRYTVTYEFLSDSVEGTPYDNSVDYVFDVTENIFCEGSWDYENNRPNRSGGYSPGGGGFSEMISSFDMANGQGYRIDSVLFNTAVNLPATLDGIQVLVSVYNWDETDSDSPDNIINSPEVTLVGNGAITFDETATNQEFATVSIMNILTLTPGYELTDSSKILVGVKYTGTESVFFGFDNSNSFALEDALGNVPSLNTDLPYIVSTASDANDIPVFADAGIFNNVREHLSTAVYVNEIVEETSINILTEAEAKIMLFPNPADQIINANVTFAEPTSRLTYSITDMQGRQIFYLEKFNITEDKNQFNIAQLPVGIYNLNIITDKGIKTERFNVQH